MAQQDTKKTDKPKDPFQAQFEALPLEEKFAKLFKLEAATLEETVTYVMNSSAKAFEKTGDVISDLGSKLNSEFKKATEPAKAAATEEQPKKPAAKPKARPSAKPKNGA